MRDRTGGGEMAEEIGLFVGGPAVAAVTGGDWVELHGGLPSWVEGEDLTVLVCVGQPKAAKLCAERANAGHAAGSAGGAEAIRPTNPSDGGGLCPLFLACSCLDRRTRAALPRGRKI